MAALTVILVGVLVAKYIDKKQEEKSAQKHAALTYHPELQGDMPPAYHEISDAKANNDKPKDSKRKVLRFLSRSRSEQHIQQGKVLTR